MSTFSFDGRGNDFLSPKTILREVHGFASGIDPVTSNNVFSFGSDPFGSNPQSKQILGRTDNTIDQIFSANFGQNLFASAQPIASGPVVAATPVFGVTQTPGFVTANTTVYNQVYQTPSPALIRDLSNFNPNIWQNPNASNVLLGTMDAQNKILGGNGLFQPPIFNNFPLYPYIAPPTPPYGQYGIPLPGQAPITNINQASLFPVTYQSGGPAFFTHVQPYAVSTSYAIVPYQTQVQLAGFLQNQLSGFSGGGFNQLNSPNGVPAWI